MSFNDDIQLVTRPPKRRKTTLPLHAAAKDKNLNKRDCIKLLHGKRNVFARPSDEGDKFVPLRFGHAGAVAPRYTSSGGGPLSPHQYSRSYVQDSYAVAKDESLQAATLYKNAAS